MQNMNTPLNNDVHKISVVIPVYRAPKQLEQLVGDLNVLGSVRETPAGLPFRVVEIILVWDGESRVDEDSMRSYASQSELARCVFMARNFGQHAATMAGIQESTGEWVATLDEDGQFLAESIGFLLDRAMESQSELVYGQPLGKSPHRAPRRLASKLARLTFRILTGRRDFAEFSSFRLITGELARNAYVFGSAQAYLDVSLSWFTTRTATVNVAFGSAPVKSSYTLKRLLSHFLRLIVVSGTRPMRIIAVLGTLSSLVGVAMAALLVYRRLVLGFPTGFASVLSVLLVLVGLILVALAVISEYLAVCVRYVVGRPHFVVVPDPNGGPLRRINQ